MARKKQVYDAEMGKRIKDARLKMGFSRQELADSLTKLSFANKKYTGIASSISAVRSWEGIGRTYNPNNATLQAIAEVLEVDYLYLLNGTIEDIVEKSRRIFEGFTPSEVTKEVCTSDLFYYKGISIEKEVAETIAIYFPLWQNGHKPQEIADTKQFLDYMKASNKNAIEFYMNNLNKGKEEE